MKFKIILILILVAILGGTFYWFQWRPTQIRKECSIYPDFTKTSGLITGNAYEKCLREHGLEK